MPFSNIPWYMFSLQNKALNFCPSLLTLLQFSLNARLMAVCKRALQPLVMSAGRSSAPVGGFIRNYRWSSNYFEIITQFVLSHTDFTVKRGHKTRRQHNLFYWALLKTALPNILRCSHNHILVCLKEIKPHWLFSQHIINWCSSVGELKKHWK